MGQKKVIVRWTGKDPDPKKFFEQVQGLGIFCKGYLLNPTFSAEQNESQILYKTEDRRDLHRFALGANLLLENKPENVSGEEVFDFHFGKTHDERLLEKVKQLEKLLAETSARIKGCKFYSVSSMKKVAENIDQRLRIHKMNP
jgi:hypothetical protein